nr:MFS transporter [Clostridium akagii]
MHFQKKNISLLMLSKFISVIGTQMQEFALSLYVLSLYVLKVTGSATLFASVLAVAIIPQLILGIFAGVLADWYDRKKIIVFLDLFNGVVVGVFTIIFLLTGSLSIYKIYGLVILLSVITAFYGPAIGTIIPSIVEKDKLIDANSISSFISNLSTLIGPVLGAMLFGFYGIFIILVANAFSFIFAGILEMFISIPKSNNKPENVNFKAFRNDFIAGLIFIKNGKFILTVVIVAVIVNFTMAPLTVCLAYVSKVTLRVSDFQFGLLEGVLAFSMVVAPIIVGKIYKRLQTGTIMFFSVFIAGILMIIMSIISAKFYLNLFKGNTIPYLSLVFLCFLVGAIVTICNISLSVAFQKAVPLEIMGRVGAVMSSGCLAAVPLGQILIGAMLDKFSTSLCLLFMGIVPVITMLIFRKNLMDEGTFASSKKA